MVSFKVRIIIILFLLFLSVSFYGHVYDDLSIKSRIHFEKEEIILKIEIASGLMFGFYYLEILDPDKDNKFKMEHVGNFSNFILSNLKVELNNNNIDPELKRYQISSIDNFLAGICSINLDYTIPIKSEIDEANFFYYENNIDAMAAIYTLHISSNQNEGVRIISEERNEMLQDSVSVKFTQGNPIISNDSINLAFRDNLIDENNQSCSLIKSTKISAIIDRIKNGTFSFKNIVFLFLLALIAGFLHAYTPGHGKALVGAYLVGNKGTIIQAIALGLIITVTHSISIYIFGGVASIAAYLFMPSKIIPYMTFTAGVFVILIGLWSFMRRLMGFEVDHAHILPNLNVLKEREVNILITGNTKDDIEYLLIEEEDALIQKKLDESNAESFNISSPGCETHKFVPRRIQQMQKMKLIRLAVETGAVDAIISDNQQIGKIKKIKSNKSISVFKSPCCVDDARNILKSAIYNYSKRGKIVIPDSSFSWKNLILLGITGGIIPCPDAMAILLISLYMGKLILGMGIVLSFSAGLSISLILIGLLIVISKKLIFTRGMLSKGSIFIPYLSSVFITFLGFYMIFNILKKGGI